MSGGIFDVCILHIKAENVQMKQSNTVFHSEPLSFLVSRHNFLLFLGLKRLMFTDTAVDFSLSLKWDAPTTARSGTSLFYIDFLCALRAFSPF